MKKPSWLSKNYKNINWVVGVLLTLSASAVTIDLESYKDTWDPRALEFTKVLLLNQKGQIGTWVWFLLFTSLIAYALLSPWLFSRIAPKWRYDIEWVRFFVERARDRAYCSVDEPLPNHHRVTLFQYVEKLPRGYKHWSSRDGGPRSGKYPLNKGWLIPVIRASHDDEDCRRSTVFMAARDKSKFEGVAGKAWMLQQTVVLTGLPPVTSSNNNNRRIYADKSSCDRIQVDNMLAGEAQSGKMLPRTIGAIVIVDNEGAPWGVLVFDSREANAFPDNVNSAVELNEMFSTTIKGMTRALGGSGYET